MGSCMSSPPAPPEDPSARPKVIVQRCDNKYCDVTLDESNWDFDNEMCFDCERRENQRLTRAAARYDID